jgi:WD40 repeat protein
VLESLTPIFLLRFCFFVVFVDGSKVIAAVGNRVLLYKADNGDLIESLRGHKDTVYSVSFSCDGSRFASGTDVIFEFVRFFLLE